MYWPQEHNDVVQKVLKKAKNGTKVVLIPGNHDEVLKDFTNFSFGEISIKNEDKHQLADGRKVLITHGDEFDAVIINARWLAKVGSALYEYLLKLNNVFNFVRRKMGLSYWSLSQYLKRKRSMQLILLVTLSLLCLIEQEEKMLMLSYVVIYIDLK